MTNVCEECPEGGLCGAKFPCKTRKSYDRWKKKAAEIGRKTDEIVARARRKAKND